MPEGTDNITSELFRRLYSFWSQIVKKIHHTCLKHIQCYYEIISFESQNRWYIHAVTVLKNVTKSHEKRYILYKENLLWLKLHIFTMRSDLCSSNTRICVELILNKKVVQCFYTLDLLLCIFYLLWNFGLILITCLFSTFVWFFQC